MSQVHLSALPPKSNKNPDDPPRISVVVPISERHDNIIKLYTLYADEIKKLAGQFEFIFILDGHFQAATEDLNELKKQGHPIKIIKFARTFGESTALKEGFKLAGGDLVLTLASYIQVEPTDIAKLLMNIRYRG